MKRDLLPPVWLMYPDISRFSIGWRMGSGEDYRYEFADWFAALTADEQAEYRRLFPPPKTWGNYWRESYDEDYDRSEELSDYYYEGVSLWNKSGAMAYTRENLTAEDTAEGFLFFWKPQDGGLTESCLGQWHPAKFKVDTDTYYCAEQYMMAEKARLFKDAAVCKAIMCARTPKQMKSLGKTARGFNQTVWDAVKHSIVLNGNYGKFSQNPDLRNFLLATGGKVLVEASPLDKIWGIGLDAEDPRATKSALWQGENRLGFALMEVRDELRRVYRHYDAIDWDKIGRLR